MPKKKQESNKPKVLKLQVPAGKATPAPPIGPALGQAGINIKAFCDEFNKKTEDLGIEKGLIVPVIITSDPKTRTFKFVLKKPPASVLIKKALKLQKGSATPNRNKIATTTWSVLKEIAKEKLSDLNTNDLDSATRIIAGTAKNLGVIIKEEE